MNGEESIHSRSGRSTYSGHTWKNPQGSAGEDGQGSRLEVAACEEPLEKPEVLLELLGFVRFFVEKVAHLVDAPVERL